MALQAEFLGWESGRGRVRLEDGREATFGARAVRSDGRTLAVGDKVLVSLEPTEAPLAPGENGTLNLLWYEGTDPGPPPPPLPKPAPRVPVVTPEQVITDLRHAGFGRSLDEGACATLVLRDAGLAESLHKSRDVAAKAALRALYGDDGPTAESLADGVFLLSDAASERPEVLASVRAALGAWIGAALPTPRNDRKPHSLADLVRNAAETLVLQHAASDGGPARLRLWSCSPAEVWKVFPRYTAFALRSEAPPGPIAFSLVEGSASEQNAASGNFSTGAPSVVFRTHAASCDTCETHLLAALEESIRVDLGETPTVYEVMTRDYCVAALDLLGARLAEGRLRDVARHGAIVARMESIQAEPVTLSADEIAEIARAGRLKADYSRGNADRALLAPGELGPAQVWGRLADVRTARDEVGRFTRDGSWDGEPRKVIDIAEDGLARWREVRAEAQKDPLPAAWETALHLETGPLNAIACVAYALEDDERAEQFVRAASAESDAKATDEPWVAWLLTGDVKTLVGPQAKKLVTAALKSAFTEVVWSRDDHEMGRNHGPRFLRDNRLKADWLAAALQGKWDDVPATAKEDGGVLLGRLRSHATKGAPGAAVVRESLEALFRFKGEDPADVAAFLPLLAIYGRAFEPGVPGLRLLRGLRAHGPARFADDRVERALLRVERVLRAARAAGRGVSVTAAGGDGICRMAMV